MGQEEEGKLRKEIKDWEAKRDHPKYKGHPFYNTIMSNLREAKRKLKKMKLDRWGNAQAKGDNE